MVAFVQALAASLVLTPVARALGPRLGMIDAPTLERKIHTTPIPRSGGLAVFAAFWGCLLLDVAVAAWVVPGLDWLPAEVRTLAGNIALRLPQLAGLATGCAIIFVLGVMDDARGLSPEVRLLVQVIATVPLLTQGMLIRMFLPEVVSWGVTALWLVLLTNSLNFLDNMNGLTAGVAAIVAAVMALQSALSGEYYMLLVFALLAGSVLGFWRYNFPRASIFLGDSGSTHLGFLLAALMILGTYYRQGVPTQLPILMPLIVLAVPLFDTASVMWIRWRAGRPLMVGDTNHFSHRLVALGMSRVEAVVFIYGATLCTGLAAVALRPLDWRYGLVQLAVIGLMFLGVYTLERVGGRRREGGVPGPRL